MRKLAWWVLIKFPSLRFLPINPLGNNAGEHNESVVPIKCIDGQLGSGRLIDFALTSGRPAGPWHAYRLMSPFTCKFKEIMRASPRKFTHTHTHIDTRTQKRRRHPRPVETGGLLKSPCNIFFEWKPRVPRSLVLYPWSGPNLWGFTHCDHWIERVR